MRLLYQVLIFSLIFSCVHGELEFQSFPHKVEISIIETDGSIKKLGETPIVVPTENVFENNSLVKLLFTKTGFRDETVYLSKPELKSRIKISTKMSEANSANEVLSSKKIEKISSKIAEAQKYSHAKNFKKAETILAALVEEYPDVSVPYDLLANVYYLTNDIERALYFYKRANEISPGNTQREFIINKLNKNSKNSETSL